MSTLDALDAEEILVGSCILWPISTLGYAAKLVRPEHLARPHLRMLYAVCLDLNERGCEVNTLSIEQELAARNVLGDCGGEHAPLNLAYLASQVLGDGQVVTACEIILDAWSRKQIVAIGKAAKEGMNIDALLERLEAVKAGSPQRNVARSGWIGEFVDPNRQRTGCASGIDLIDKSVSCGGWPDGQMSMVAAYTGGGKSSLMLQSAKAIASRGERVCYATFADLNAGDIGHRLVKSMCGWTNRPEHPIAALEFEEAVEFVRKLPIWIYDSTEQRHGKEFETFSSALIRRHSETPFRACFVDYAQKLRVRGGHNMNSLERGDAASDGVRWLAAETNLPIIVGSQVTEGNEREGRRTITKGTRTWEEDAGLVIRLKRLNDKEKQSAPEEYRAIKGLTSADICKSRFGEAKEDFLEWRGSRLCFVDV